MTSGILENLKGTSYCEKQSASLQVLIRFFYFKEICEDTITAMELTMMDDMHLSLVRYFDGGNSDCFRYYNFT